jgi:hypothetical protein
MSSATSSEMPSTGSSQAQNPLIQQAMKAGLSRWKLESLTGLLGIKALQHHQAETEKNIAAEGRAVRRKLWESNEPDSAQSASSETGDDMKGGIILGDNVVHPPQVIMAGGQQQQGSGLGKVLAGAALGASLLGVPGAGIAGYLLSQMNQKPAVTPSSPADPVETETVDLGLKKIEDLEL